MTTNLNVTRNWCLKRMYKKYIYDFMCLYIYIYYLFVWGGAVGFLPRASNWLEMALSTTANNKHLIR